MEKEWGKLVHVGSSLPSKPEQYALFVGRWQPLHDGHKALFARALDEGKNVWIAIRDIAPDEKNPWTAEEFRHILKTISYRIFGTLTTVTVAYSLGASLSMASLLGVGELVIKPIIYFFHERLWYKHIRIGKKG